MIDRVSIQNFKSIKNLSFDCRRVNVFIGEPNVGKSNLLEALGVFALTWENYTRILRYRTFYDLFVPLPLSRLLPGVVESSQELNFSIYD